MTPITDGSRLPPSKRITRRELLRTTLISSAGIGLAACAGENTPEEATATPEVSATVEAAPHIFVGEPKRARNAIVIVLDSLRADHVGCYGNDWIRTPTLDSLAKESIVFTRAYPESLPTIPMRRALHTGMRAWPFRDWVRRTAANNVWAGWAPIEDDVLTLAEILVKQGFQTGFVTDTYHYFAPGMNFHRGFKQFLWVRGQEADAYRSILPISSDEVEAVFNPNVPEELEGMKYFTAFVIASHLANQAGRSKEEDYPAPRVFREAMDWLDENKKAERFFLLVDAFDPHEPWDPPQKYIDLYDAGYEGKVITAPIYGVSSYLSEGELNHMRARYAAEVTLVDKWLGRFLDRARDLGMLDDTLVVVTSDHGHQLGEHGIVGKLPIGLWYELVDVPLLLTLPNREGAGSRVEAFAQHQDIVPTLLRYLGVDATVPLPGLDLVGLWEGHVEPRERISCGMNDYSLCRDERYAYMVRHDGTNPKLYDMTADPLQQHDLADEERGAVNEMHSKLLADAGGELPGWV